MATLAQRLQAEIDRANETTSKTDTLFIMPLAV